MTIPVPAWYAEKLGPGFEPIDPGSEARGRLLAGLRLLRTTRGIDRYAVLGNGPGSDLLLIGSALAGRGRCVVVLELLPRRLAARGPRRWARVAWERGLLGPAMRRVMVRAQVLTPAERGAYARRFGLPLERLELVRWPFSRGLGPAAHPPPRPGSKLVLASGRASTDWETVMRAAQGRDWELTVVCRTDEEAALGEMAAATGTRVLSEIDRGEHDALLAAARVYILALIPGGPSAGHGRLMAATDAHTPVVATAAPGLEGYIDPDRTAVVVDAGDPVGLGEAVDSLLADPSWAAEIAAAAADRGAARTYAEYFTEIAHLLSG